MTTLLDPENLRLIQTVKGQASDEDENLRLVQAFKHLGPGDHPSGTPQSVHGGEGGGGSSNSAESGGGSPADGGGSRGRVVFHMTSEEAASSILEGGLKRGKSWNRRPPAVYFSSDLSTAFSYVDLLRPKPASNIERFGVVEFGMPDDAQVDTEDRDAGLENSWRVEHDIAASDIIAVHVYERHIGSGPAGRRTGENVLVNSWRKAIKPASVFSVVLFAPPTTRSLADTLMEIAKHLGPGDHPSGSGQDVHGGEGAGGSGTSDQDVHGEGGDHAPVASAATRRTGHPDGDPKPGAVISFDPQMDTDEAVARKEFLRVLRAQYPKGLPVYHEAPAAAMSSIVHEGLRSGEFEDTFFGTVGKTRGFVTSTEKTLVRFWVKPAQYASSIIPDMRYGGTGARQPAAEMLRSHGGTYGADVAFNGPVGPSMITHVWSISPHITIRQKDTLADDLLEVLQSMVGKHLGPGDHPSGSGQDVHGEGGGGGDYPKAGATVDGLQVMDEIPNQDSISATLDEYEVLPGVRELPMSAFDSDPKDLFYAADDHKRVKALAEKIKQSGRIAPLIVVVDEKGPYVLEGAHRLGALHLLGKTALPALVVLDKDKKGLAPRMAMILRRVVRHLGPGDHPSGTSQDVHGEGEGGGASGARGEQVLGRLRGIAPVQNHAPVYGFLLPDGDWAKVGPGGHGEAARLALGVPWEQSATFSVNELMKLTGVIRWSEGGVQLSPAAQPTSAQWRAAVRNSRESGKPLTVDILFHDASMGPNASHMFVRPTVDAVVAWHAAEVARVANPAQVAPPKKPRKKSDVEQQILDAFRNAFKHLGPGDHPGGSPQSVHAGNGGGSDKPTSSNGPPTQTWRDPPPARGTGGLGAVHGGESYAAESLTGAGRLGEALASRLGFTNLHPGKSQGRFDVAAGDYVFELKGCSVLAKEYKAKPSRAAVRQKLKEAKRLGKKPGTMIVVLEPALTSMRGHVYWRAGLGAFRLGPESKDDWNYAGTTTVPLSTQHVRHLGPGDHPSGTSQSVHGEGGGGSGLSGGKPNGPAHTLRVGTATVQLHEMTDVSGLGPGERAVNISVSREMTDDEFLAEKPTTTPEAARNVRQALNEAVTWARANGVTHLTAEAMHPGVQRLMRRLGATVDPTNPERLWLPVALLPKKDAFDEAFVGVFKHIGPGDHPSGSGQDVHGGEGGGASEAEFVARAPGSRVASDAVAGLTRPNHFYRGMTQTEYDVTLAAGRGVGSRQDFSHVSEGTSFADGADTAESYVNFGRDDPRQTGRPTYLVEIQGSDGLARDPDGYWKAPVEIPRERVARIWEFRADEHGALVARLVSPSKQLSSLVQHMAENLRLMQEYR